MKPTIALLGAAASLLLPIRSPAQSIIPWSAVDMGFVISSSPATMVKSVVGQGFVVCDGVLKLGAAHEMLLRILAALIGRGHGGEEIAVEKLQVG